MTRLSQKSNSIDIVMEALYSVLRYSYAEWLPTKVASKIVEPVPQKMAEIFKPNLEQLLGYFEDLINKLVAYNAYGNIDKSDDRQLEADYESKEASDLKRTIPPSQRMGKLVALNFTGSEATGINDVDISQPSFRKFTEKVNSRKIRSWTQFSFKISSIQLKTEENLT